MPYEVTLVPRTIDYLTEFPLAAMRNLPLSCWLGDKRDPIQYGLFPFPFVAFQDSKIRPGY